MPLPAYLLERLKKRNVIQDSVEATRSQIQETKSEQVEESNYQRDNKPELHEQKIDEEQEEIIAEDYSDEDQSDHQNQNSYNSSVSDSEQKESADYRNLENVNFSHNTSRNSTSYEYNVDGKDEDNHDTNNDNNDRDDNDENDDDDDDDDMTNCDNSSLPPNLFESSQSVLGCPNKYNIYHHCSQYCIDNYNNLETTSPTMEQRKQLALLLKTYPMSNEWTTVYDPGVKTFYFWNIITNLVSWLPPSMNSLVSLSADQIRRSMLDQQDVQDYNLNETQQQDSNE